MHRPAGVQEHRGNRVRIWRVQRYRIKRCRGAGWGLVCGGCRGRGGAGITVGQSDGLQLDINTRLQQADGLH